MPECQTAFDQIKKALTSDLFHTHCDPKLEIIVASDASSYGVGACILHKIAHASRFNLSPTWMQSYIQSHSNIRFSSSPTLDVVLVQH